MTTAAAVFLLGVAVQAAPTQPEIERWKKDAGSQPLESAS